MRPKLVNLRFFEVVSLIAFKRSLYVVLVT